MAREKGDEIKVGSGSQAKGNYEGRRKKKKAKEKKNK